MILSAFDNFGRLKPVTPDEVAEAEPILDDLFRRLDAGPTDPCGTAIALWIELGTRLIRAGIPPEMIVSTAQDVAHRLSCAGSA